MWLISIITILILVISFIEIAFLTINPQRIYKYVQKDSRAKVLINMLNNQKNSVITTFSAIFTILDTIFVLLMEDIFNNSFFAYILIPTIVLVFFEVIPKSLAPFIAEKIALKSVYITQFILILFSPIRIILDGLIRILAKIFKFNKISQESHISEIKSTLEHHYAQGKMFKYEKNIIDNFLSISNITVEDVMKHRTEMVSISMDMNINDMIKTILQSRHTRFPVWENNSENIIGILNIYLLFEEMHKNKFNINKINLKTCINKPTFIQLNTTLNEQILGFMKSKQHMAIITNEYGEVEGLITLEDIVEVIFGKIYDEKEINYIKNNIVKVNKDTFIVDLDTTLHDIYQELDIFLKTDLASTINGFLSYKLNKIPEENNYITEGQYTISLVMINNEKKIKIFNNGGNEET